MRPEGVPDELAERVLETRLPSGGLPSLNEPQVRTILTALLPEIQAQALREAADVWQRGAWADAPRRADRVQERIANGKHVSEWLRARAARLTDTSEGEEK